MTVFVVTSGEYSDYRIDGVFSTHELAQDFIRYGGGDTIEEWDVDARQEDRPITEVACTMKLDDGSCRHDGGPQHRCAKPTRHARVHTTGLWGKKDLLVVWSPLGIEHAHKVAVEQRQKFLATGAVDPEAS